jgi:hypothetical protein
LTKPTIQGTRAPAANANGWNNEDVTVSFTCSDSTGGSGVASCPADVTLSSEGDNQSVMRSVSDNAGNNASTTVSDIRIDKTNPTIDASVLNDPDADTGWYNISTGGPIVHFVCNDTLSGIATGACPANHTITEEGSNVSYSASVSDRADNSASDGVSGLKVDLTRPDAAGAPDLLATSDSGDQNDNLTNDRTPTFDITAEAGSTVKLYAKKDNVETFLGQATANNGVATITSQQTLSDGEYQVYAHVIDQAGNVSDTNVLNITIVTIDGTPPADPGLNMTAGDTGVSTNDAKTMNDKPTFGGSAEAGSTLKLYDGTVDEANLLTPPIQVGAGGSWSFTPTTALSEGIHHLKATATDAANNTSSVSQLDAVIDKTAPATNCGSASANWLGSDASIHCVPSDGLSGLADSGDASFNLVTNVASGTEDSNASTNSRDVYDVAGNKATAGPISGNKVDKKAPSITYVDQTAAQPPNFNVGGSNQWFISPVEVRFSASDGGSGLTSGVTSPFTKNSGNQEGSSVKVASGTVSDAVGNTASSINSSDSFKVDLSNPSAPTFSGIQATTYPVANLPAQNAISCSSTDAISPPANCAVTGYSSAFGSHELTATATDQAGRQNTSTLTYTVGLQAGEVLSPINSTGKANIAATNLDVFKIKSTIPVKFQVFNDAAKTKLMTSPPAGSVAKITFLKQDNTTDSNDAAEVLPSSNANTDNIYRWTGSPDYQYIYNLGTTGQKAGTYSVQLTLYASDGTTVLAQSAKYYFVLRT